MSDLLPWERPLGSRVLDDERTEFRVWAPSATDPHTLGAREGVRARGTPASASTRRPLPARAGEDYVYEVDGQRLPDPCSRWQPAGLRGPSRVLAPPPRADRFARAEPGAARHLRAPHRHLHPRGDVRGRRSSTCRELAELGITAIEIMPVAEFPGARGWGYDGVYLSAAQSSYGGPEGLALTRRGRAQRRARRDPRRRLQPPRRERCRGVRGVRPVLHQHLRDSVGQGDQLRRRRLRPGARMGPARAPRDGCATSGSTACDSTRSTRFSTPAPSTSSPPSRAASTRSRPMRYVIAESGLNDPIVMRPVTRGGWNCDAAWADDFHHALHALMTGDRDGYYCDFGRVAQLAKAFHRPHVNDGSYSAFRRRRFGAPADDVPRDAVRRLRPGPRSGRQSRLR